MLLVLASELSGNKCKVVSYEIITLSSMKNGEKNLTDVAN